MPLTLRRAHTAAAAAVAIVLAALCLPSIVHAAAQPRLIVGFRPTATAAQQRATLGRSSIAAKAAVPRLRAAVVRVKPGQLAATRRALLRRPDVAYVEVDHVAHAYDLGAQAASGVAAKWVPNDTMRSQQWALQTMGAYDAWELARGTGVTIAVIDTGVDYIHPDLQGRVDLGRDFVDGDADPMDVQGHGTHVAGIAAASADDGFGVAGVAPGARVLAVRVLDGDGEGNYSQVASGITYAADHGAKVLNLSLGGPEKSELLRAAIDYASAKGAIVTCAAGNEASDELGYPARYDSCVSVGATDISDSHAEFSNVGAGLDISAPGVGILSSTMGGAFDSWDGTSMASPQVAGAAALLASQGLGRRAVVGALTSTAHDLGAAGTDTTYGAGRLDVAAAVAAAARQPRAAADTVAPTVATVTTTAVRRTTKRTVKTQWAVRSRTPFRRVGTTAFPGTYAYSKTTRRGKQRFVDTFRFRSGIVYRRRVVQVLRRRVVRQTAVVLPVTVAASDDQGVDRVAVSIDGVTAGVDWSAGGGWSVTAPCKAGSHAITATAYDAADNAGSASVRRTVRC
jgi:thermitase